MKKQTTEAFPKTTLEDNPANGLPIDNIPLVYVDQMVGLAIGPFVSKIVLAVENPPAQPTPKITIAMPTQSLHLMAKQLNEILSTKETQDQFSAAFKTYQETVSG